ncbi:Hypothetical predicted protein, partial [Pelobates cultripes]
MEKDLRTLNLKDNTKDNLTKKERKALKQLMEEENITIRGADKGGGLVILNTTDYKNENQRLLQDTNTYQILTTNPTNEFQLELQKLLEE